MSTYKKNIQGAKQCDQKMLLREPIHKTKIFFNKTRLNLRSFFFGGYQKLPKPPSCHPFSCGSSRREKKAQMDQFYADFCNEWEFDTDKNRRSRTRKSMKEQAKDEEDPLGGTSTVKHAEQNSLAKNNQGEVEEERAKKVAVPKTGKREKKVSEEMNTAAAAAAAGGGGGGGCVVLARRMKELEMMDVSDMEQVLDVEEALHYYSRLRSPVYVEIVDKFFMDMYSDFSIPEEQQQQRRRRRKTSLATTSNSKRRLGSVRF